MTETATPDDDSARPSTAISPVPMKTGFRPVGTFTGTGGTLSLDLILDPPP
ncbi:hypothetical protein ACIBSV_33140 [Embleya sp. NPDC050154]|uniref:hypothetical protein n=1 Tax=unclassified Embleya TaxID=2699296 RepID=UPI0037B836A7